MQICHDMFCSSILLKVSLSGGDFTRITANAVVRYSSSVPEHLKEKNLQIVVVLPQNFTKGNAAVENKYE